LEFYRKANLPENWFWPRRYYADFNAVMFDWIINGT